MTNREHEGVFEQELRHALQYLYDPAELRKSKLLPLLGIDVGQSPLTQLRRSLSDAIEKLKPGTHVPAEARAWRVYNILTYRFIERLSQRETAADLNLSVRQLRRSEHEAIRVLTHTLKAYYQTGPSSEQLQQDEDNPTGVIAQNHVQELEWLQRTLPSEALDIHELLESVLRTAAPLLQESNVRITTNVPEDVPMLMGQSAALRQALLNTLSAAMPATGGGQGHIQVSSSNDEIKISIYIGWNDEGRVPMTEQLTGSLAISRKLMELGGGLLDTSSETGGCSIILTLPSAIQMRIPIHIIDDNADTLQLFHRYLTGTPYAVTSSRDPEEALAAVVEAAPRAIVLDVMLPGVDGWEILGRLREHPQTREIPVVVCTILPQEKLALALGAAVFLQKPFTRDGLLSVLASLTRSQD